MALNIDESFRPRLGARWRATQVGGGRLALVEEGLRLALVGASAARYADAQIDDYAGMARRDFPWRPPLRLLVRARASGPLLGTAGFGFWNNPFSPLGGWPALPAAIWFFHASPPSDMPLALGVPGYGWKAACIDATTPRALAWSPLALPVALANQSERMRRRVWPRVQRDLRIAEAPIEPPGAEWREYAIEWREDGARFAIDGRTVLATDRAPRGPLGFVAWVDNQWMVATPRGHFGWGLVDVPGQWMDLGMVSIEMLGR
ncbi:hypothetical protein [Kouleothrix sp.]|uniref:hypothetical protein n=1 Tax=Kouleothrix sp. TaxID=2779161 RepID=UPI00391A2482